MSTARVRTNFGGYDEQVTNRPNGHSGPCGTFRFRDVAERAGTESAGCEAGSNTGCALNSRRNSWFSETDHYRRGRKLPGDSAERAIQMNTSTRIHWGRVWIGGFLAEVGIFAVFIPAVLLFGEEPARYTVPPAAFVMTFLFAVWVGRGIESRFVLHGILVGVVATLLYVGLTLAQPEPLLYIVAHGLKILGGAAGARVAGKRKSTATVPG